MRLRTIGLIAGIAIGALPRTASAHDEPRPGITMGSPASPEMIWRATDTLASGAALYF